MVESSSKNFLVGLSEICSKNYNLTLDKVEYAPLPTVPDSSKPTHTATAYNIKTEIKRQQKHLSNEELELIVQKHLARMTLDRAIRCGNDTSKSSVIHFRKIGVLFS